jgi:hypothetical protein
VSSGLICQSHISIQEEEAIRVERSMVLGTLAALMRREFCAQGDCGSSFSV